MTPDQRPRKLVGVSTKMYFDLEKTRSYVQELSQQLRKRPELLKDVDIFFIPDFVSLSTVSEELRNSGVLIGAQDCFYEDKGAYTGEVSPSVLREAGCGIVELGHAERRRLFAENDAITAKKSVAAARNGLIPLVCIGELTRGDVSVAVDECRPQITSILDSLPSENEVVFAYEPVWAIGQADPASADHVVAVVKELRKLCEHRQGTTRFLYGGSARPGIFEKLAEAVDGLFLGRFAHDPEAFIKTIEDIVQG